MGAARQTDNVDTVIRAGNAAVGTDRDEHDAGSRGTIALEDHRFEPRQLQLNSHCGIAVR